MTTLSLLVHCQTIAYTAFTLAVLVLLPQWIPNQQHTCWRLIYDALTSDAIEEVEFREGQVVDRQRILHHFNFRSFRIFGFFDDFAMPTACPGDSVSMANNYEHNIQRAFIPCISVATGSRHRLYTYLLVLLGPCLLLSFGRMTAVC